MPIITYGGVDYPLPNDDTTSTKVIFYNETIQKILARLFGPVSAGGFGQAWTAWTPSLTNIAIGTGGSALLTAKYVQIGKLVFCRVTIILGTSGASVSGAIALSLPVTAITYPGSTVGVAPLGTAAFLDAATASYSGAVAWNSTTTVTLQPFDTSGTYSKKVVTSATIPFAFGAGDEVHAEFVYEAA